MTRATIDRSRLGDLVEAAGADALVYAPAASQEAEAVELEVVAAPSGRTAAMERMTFSFTNTRHSVKRLFFPQTELMFRYDNGATSAAADARPSHGIVVFGVRPCDARSVTYLDKIFDVGLTQYGDPYYTERRERSVVIAYACSAPCSTCFCTAVGGGPAGTSGADALLSDAPGGKLLLEAVTEKGKRFVEQHRALLAEAGADTLAAVESAHQAAHAAVPALPTPGGVVDRDALKARMDRAFEDPAWNRLTESCIGCGACTYLCPTCHCFDIADEERMYQGRRIRTWDSCQYALFTKHASGHNPRPARKHRMRQRFMHKFSYTVEKSGDVYCVGCGRCVTQCPVNLDIREVIRAFSAPGA